MFANWLAVVFYTQASIVTYNYAVTNKQVNRHWLYVIGAFALGSHVWIITAYNLSNQPTLYTILFSSLAYIAITKFNNYKIPAAIFLGIATLLGTTNILDNQLDIATNIHLIAASILLATLLYTALLAINILEQNKRLRSSQAPAKGIPALETLEAKFYTNAKIALASTLVTITTSIQKLNSLNFSTELAINLILTGATTFILVLINQSKQRNLVKSKNSRLMLLALILFAIICVTCILLRR